MEYIAHRINTIKLLKSVPTNYGVEVDIRDYEDRIILQHDPFEDGEDFEKYLREYNHGTIILNIKSERIEYKVLELIKKYKIKNYFFLDSSFPMIFNLCKDGEQNIALRYSEFEGFDTIINMQKKIKWVWVDCFTEIPINNDIFKKFKSIGLKLCFVSPELQNQEYKIQSYKEYLKINQIHFDAICTKQKNIELWNS